MPSRLTAVIKLNACISTGKLSCYKADHSSSSVKLVTPSDSRGLVTANIASAGIKGSCPECALSVIRRCSSYLTKCLQWLPKELNIATYGSLIIVSWLHWLHLDDFNVGKAAYLKSSNFRQRPSVCIMQEISGRQDIWYASSTSCRMVFQSDYANQNCDQFHLSHAFYQHWNSLTQDIICEAIWSSFASKACHCMD